MKELHYRPPCDANGEFADWLNDLRNQSGAYIIRQASNHQCLYVGECHSGSLAKTVKRHFWKWRDDAERRHHTYDRRRVEVAVRLTPPPAATGAQNNLIARLNPKDNGTGWPAEEPW